MDALKGVQHYTNKFVNSVGGIKVLLLDAETVRANQQSWHWKLVMTLYGRIDTYCLFGFHYLAFTIT